MGFSPTNAAFKALVVLLILSMLKKDTRLSFKDIIDALEKGARDILGVAAATACAGIIIGVLTLTGLAVKLSSMIIQLSGGNLFILLFLAMIVSIILGMGLPTAACYVLLAALVVPALIEFGVPVLAAHLFVFFFGVISAITPPVALAAYTAAGIAESNPMSVGVNAFKIGAVAFFVPYVGVYNPAFILDGSFLQVIKVVMTSLVGCSALVFCVQGYLFKKLSLPMRFLLLISALTLIDPKLTTDFIGIAIYAIVVLFQKFIQNSSN
ncbi:C4-dicarboxylate ABC transporter [Calderihabitans maritimus]|uniref:C4-dicarboxylate ABC transporter n=2 Tax=Calderihabitans maritimus TaxID=1246530 RepID=A0A1Z5HSN4_9FIRM|nr:C4-dicarboxylate ABC transporter [Calderihabitans maritimus]